MSRYRNITVFLIGVILLIPSLMPLSGYGGPAVNAGLMWLTSTQTTKGYWGGWSTPALRDTTESANAFYVIDPSYVTYSTALDLLSSITPLTVDDASRVIYSLSTAKIETSAILDYLLLWRKPDGGWGLDSEHESGIINTALALQALKAANYSDLSIVNAGLAFLTSSQNSDGGWGYRPTTTAEAGDPSNAYVTAHVLRTLSEYDSIFNVKDSKSRASAYLLSKQNTDGGFGSSPSTIYETALSVISLIESGQGSALPLQNAIAYLAASQSSNDSWNDDPYSTALALQAMAKVKPNLSITATDISFSQTTPVPGESVAISVTVHNTRLAAADSVVLQLFDGDPAAGGVQIVQ